MLRDMLTPKRIFIGTFLLLVFVLSYFLLNYSFLTIKNSSQDSKNISIFGPEGPYKTFVLGSEPKKLLLKRGSYTVEATGDSRFSSYQRDMGIFKSDELIIDLLPQKNSSFIDKSVLGCVKELEDKTPTFYSCNPSNSTTFYNIQQSFESVSENSIEAPEVSMDSEATETSGVLKSYMGGFLEARTLNNELLVKKIDGKDPSKVSESVVIPNYSDPVNDSVFSVSPTPPGFSVYNPSSFELTHLSGFGSEDFEKIKIDDKKIKEGSPLIDIYTTPDFVFIVAKNSLENSSNIDDGSDEEDSAIILVVDLAKKEVINKKTLVDDLKITSITTGPNNNLILISRKDNRDTTYMMGPELKLNKLNTRNSVRQFCIKDLDSVYYSADEGRSVYLYSVSKRASYLLYSTPSDIITSLNCVDGRLYFVLEKEGDGETNNYLHYVLGQDDQKGVRLDSVLPAYIESGGNLLKAVQVRGSVLVELVSNNTASLPDKDLVRNEVVKFLQEQGINTEKLVINFGY